MMMLGGYFGLNFRMSNAAMLLRLAVYITEETSCELFFCKSEKNILCLGQIVRPAIIIHCAAAAAPCPKENTSSRHGTIET